MEINGKGLLIASFSLHYFSWQSSASAVQVLILPMEMGFLSHMPRHSSYPALYSSRVVHLVPCRPDLEVSHPVRVNLLPGPVSRGGIAHFGKVGPHLQHAWTHLKPGMRPWCGELKDIIFRKDSPTRLSTSLRTIVTGTWWGLNSMNSSSAWQTPSLDLD